jgi:hypothetical protein
MEKQGRKKGKIYKPELSAVSQMSDWDFLVAFTNFFGLRRSSELIGLTLLWRAAGLVPASGELSVSKLVNDLEARGVSSKSATYRAASDLGRFVEYFEECKVPGVTVVQLVDRLAQVQPQIASPVGEPVVE